MQVLFPWAIIHVMPARNTIREYVPHSYYHIYNCGVEKRRIFLDEKDYSTFLSLLERHLVKDPDFGYGRLAETYYDSLELQAYCLMPNHFHLLVYVNDDPRAITKLMRRVCTAYTMYFNRKYKRSGPLLQSRFKAGRITSEPHAVHVSRYIHLRPKEYKSWPFSSVQHFIGDWQTEWVRPDRLYGLYEYGTYEKLLDDYEGHKLAVEEIKHSLADYKKTRK